MAFVRRKPNFIIFMTDQQRTIQDFPEEWVAENLPNYTKFLTDGASFPENICNTSPCGPSRASVFTGMYPSENGVTSNFGTIEPCDMTFANILNNEGYDVHYMGKLHMRKDITDFSTTWPEEDSDNAAQTAFDENSLLENDYGMYSWTSPDFGTMLVQGTDLTKCDLANLAAGGLNDYGYNDKRVVTGEGNISPEPSSVREVLERLQSDEQEKPFCLVISLLNPHDVSMYPEGWEEAGYKESDFTNSSFDDFELPRSYADSLNSKPNVQAAYLNTSCHGKLIDTPDTSYALEYLKFYAYLHKLSDELLGSVMDSLKKKTLQRTMLIRMADHGEMGMSHGGLQEKNFSMYNEMIRVPMIWMHPDIKSGIRPQMVSLIDLVPTLGALAGANLSDYPQLQGVDYSEAIFNPNAPSQEAVLFNFPYNAPPPSDDEALVEPQGMYIQNPNAPAGTTPTDYPNNIYAMITSESKFAVYYKFDENEKLEWGTAEFELYDLNTDPDEMTNLIPVPANEETYSDIHLELIRANFIKLTELIISKRIKFPNGWNYFNI